MLWFSVGCCVFAFLGIFRVPVQPYTSGFTIISQVFSECWLVASIQWPVGPFQGHFGMSSENISFFLKKKDMSSKKGRIAAQQQCYSYATWKNPSKADAQSTSNEGRFKLMRSTYMALHWLCIH